MRIKGKIWKFGDNIDTDIIIPAKYLAMTDPKSLGEHCMEPIAPSFHEKVKKDDIIVAGSNFGCGSSREHAPIAISALGIPLVIAKSFARIFYRNAFNKGLALLEADVIDNIDEGEEVEIDLSSGVIRWRNMEVTAKPIPSFMVELINEGGLINYLKKQLEE
ncbi:MAG: 3-isopropylmalate dehydratase small subunit [Syntrophorhabdaceae bacterium]|jgi:3-isopropylmalate/(R)-2-methylmalate dehydratase small subunit|nr:3-isopropylmalate dehydratase small subunit [Syntrophorhabdaceae bacterium]MDD5245252.1 3-isopropylmalate dehydratase small subunit [Syntrophorhabdaceae bacterium]